nr:DUF397 domain-containing protein [Streptomyces sp. NBC_00857]
MGPQFARNIPGTVAVRDSKAPAGPVLLLARARPADGFLRQPASLRRPVGAVGRLRGHC